MGGRVFQATGIASAKVLGFKSFVERNSETLVPTLALICDKSHPPPLPSPQEEVLMSVFLSL